MHSGEIKRKNKHKCLSATSEFFNFQMKLWPWIIILKINLSKQSTDFPRLLNTQWFDNTLIWQGPRIPARDSIILINLLLTRQDLSRSPLTRYGFRIHQKKFDNLRIALGTFLRNFRPHFSGSEVKILKVKLLFEKCYFSVFRYEIQSSPLTRHHKGNENHVELAGVELARE